MSIYYCPGCLRTSDQVDKEGCGSQRCPDFERVDTIEEFTLKVNERITSEAAWKRILAEHFSNEKKG